jgi:SAM-dependent methyltransferase
MYEESLQSPCELFSDYETLNVDSFKEGYCTCLFRKYLWSNANDFILELSDLHDGDHLLDAGCGIGVQAIHFCRKLHHLTISCIVNTKNCYDKTVENIKKANLSNRIQVYLMDFDKLEEPILSQRFDRILMNQTMGYSTNRKMLFHNLHALLRPEGKLFLSTLTVKPTVDPDQIGLIQKAISIWKYNFSELNCILYDLKDYPVKYITLRPEHTTWVFMNPLDLYYLYEFNRLNHLELTSDQFFFTKILNIQFLLVG